MFKKLIVIAVIAILSLGIQAGIASADLVINGGFETADFTGWTLNNINLDTDFVFVVPGGHSGNYEAVLGKTGAVGSISQTLVTQAGQGYTVSYWLANDMPGTNSFQVLWNGGAIQSASLNNTNAFGYTEYQFSAIGSGSDSIAFAFRNDPSTFHLDDVSATATPIPAAAWLLGSGLLGLVGMRKRIQI